MQQCSGSRRFQARMGTRLAGRRQCDREIDPSAFLRWEALRRPWSEVCRATDREAKEFLQHRAELVASLVPLLWVHDPDRITAMLKGAALLGSASPSPSDKAIRRPSTYFVTSTSCRNRAGRGFLRRSSAFTSARGIMLLGCEGGMVEGALRKNGFCSQYSDSKCSELMPSSVSSIRLPRS